MLNFLDLFSLIDMYRNEFIHCMMNAIKHIYVKLLPAGLLYILTFGVLSTQPEQQHDCNIILAPLGRTERTAFIKN